MSFQTGTGNCSSTALRPVVEDGKWAARTADPAAESVPLGLEVTSPKPATPVVRSVAPRATKRATPATRVGAGRRVTIVPIRSQRPGWCSARADVPVGQKTARPKMASSAGSSVRPASSMRAMPIASAGPRLW